MDFLSSREPLALLPQLWLSPCSGNRCLSSPVLQFNWVHDASRPVEPHAVPGAVTVASYPMLFFFFFLFLEEKAL